MVGGAVIRGGLASSRVNSNWARRGFQRLDLVVQPLDSLGVVGRCRMSLATGAAGRLQCSLGVVGVVTARLSFCEGVICISILSALATGWDGGGLFCIRCWRISIANCCQDGLAQAGVVRLEQARVTAMMAVTYLISTDSQQE